MSKKTKQPFKVLRLQFTEEERADPVLKKPISKSEKAAYKLEKAGDKIPKKTVKTKERTFDAETGRAKVRLHFEEVDKPKPPSKLTHGISKEAADLPVNAAQAIDSSKVSDHHAIIPTMNIKGLDIQSLPAGERETLLLLAIRLLVAMRCPPLQ